MLKPPVKTFRLGAILLMGKGIVKPCLRPKSRVREPSLTGSCTMPGSSPSPAKVIASRKLRLVLACSSQILKTLDFFSESPILTVLVRMQMQADGCGVKGIELAWLPAARRGSLGE
jgi:hypothetical protein